MYNIIEKKKHGRSLSSEEIKWVISGYMSGSIKDYQMSALLMSIYFNQMDDRETADLTDAMLYSGRTLNFNDPTVVDKHSTGGIGDKASFILAPIAAACGVKVPMIAGRGLGFTGGTVDKVEAIKGFKTNLNLDEFGKQLLENGIVLMGQTDEIAPADKRIYALRDVSATIDSIPLITASIMSKKLAEGANGIVMDIKVGSGAFMSSKAEAKKLAKSIIKTADRFDKKSVCLITNMNQPLGHNIGHSLEIIESLETLKGKGPKDLTDLSLSLAAHMVVIAGIEKSYNKALKKCKQALSSHKALDVFKNLIKIQGGDTSVIDDYSKLDLAPCKLEVKATKSGYIKTFKNKKLGFLCTDLGGGRKTKSDSIDFGVGFIVHKKLSDKVKLNETVVTIYHRKTQQKLAEKIAQEINEQVIKITKTKPAKAPVIYDVLKSKKDKSK